MLKRINWKKVIIINSLLATSAFIGLAHAEDAAPKKYVRQGVICSTSESINSRLGDPELHLDTDYYAHQNIYIRGPFSLTPAGGSGGLVCFVVTGL